MNTPTNKEIVAALEACLKYLSPTKEISPGRTHLICFALIDAACRELTGKHDNAVKYIRERIITPRMHPHRTLQAWLRENHGVSDEALGADNGRHLQTHRRQWVKRLIQEFSK